MGNGIGTYLFRVARDGNCLEYPFAADRNGIAVITQYVTENHELQRLLVIFLSHVEGDVFHCAQLVSVLFIPLQLLG